MKNLIIALVVLAIVGVGVYYLVFSNGSNGTPGYTPTATATNNLNTDTPVPTEQPSVSPTPTTTPTASASKTPAPATAAVSIKNLAFSPATRTIKVGTKVTWTNNDSVSHTVTSDSDNLLSSSTLAPGQSFSFTFTAVGTTNYHCTVHPTMKGSIIVTN